MALLLAVPAAPLRAHDTGSPHEAPVVDLRDTGSGPLDPARLGTSENRLRELFGEALRETPIDKPRPLLEQIRERSALAAGEAEAETSDGDTEAADRFPGQVRLTRPVDRAGLHLAQYELFDEKVYRIRWQLAEPFERPIMDALVAVATAQLGPPAYDQLLKAKLGSPKAELRRAGWRRGDRTLEVRQLHPLYGGPVYLSVTDGATAGEILASQGSPMPEPDSTGPWRERTRAEPKALTPYERETLANAFRALLAQADFAAAD